MKSNRFMTAILLISLLAIGFAQDTSGRAQGPNAPIQNSDRLVPTPGPTEVAIIFDSGVFAVAKINQRISTPKGEKFRLISGEKVKLAYVELGDTSGNLIWEVDPR